MKGKFIVIDGTDGSGKATQTELLVQKLKQQGYEVEVADFPQYGKKSATLVEEYLNGNFGSAKEVGPYRGSIFYAVDLSLIFILDVFPPLNKSQIPSESSAKVPGIIAIINNASNNSFEKIYSP